MMVRLSAGYCDHAISQGRILCRVWIAFEFCGLIRAGHMFAFASNVPVL